MTDRKRLGKLQDELRVILKNNGGLNMLTTEMEHWDDIMFREILFVVQDRVNRNSEVIECDPYRDWLDKFRFFLADNKDFTFAKKTAIITSVSNPEE